MCSHCLSMLIPFSQAWRTTNTHRANRLSLSELPSGETTRYPLIRGPDSSGWVLPRCLDICTLAFTWSLSATRCWKFIPGRKMHATRVSIHSCSHVNPALDKEFISLHFTKIGCWRHIALKRGLASLPRASCLTSRCFVLNWGGGNLRLCCLSRKASFPSV